MSEGGNHRLGVSELPAIPAHGLGEVSERPPYMRIGLGKIGTMWAFRATKGWTETSVWRCVFCGGLVVTGKIEPFVKDGVTLYDGRCIVHERSNAGCCEGWLAGGVGANGTGEAPKHLNEAYRATLERLEGPFEQGAPLPPPTDWAKRRPAGAQGYVRTAVCPCGEYVQSFRCHGDHIILHDGFHCADFLGLSPCILNGGTRPKINKDWYLDQLETVEVNTDG